MQEEITALRAEKTTAPTATTPEPSTDGARRAQALQNIISAKGKLRDKKEGDTICAVLRELPDQAADEPKYVTNIRATIEERTKILATGVQYGWEHSDLVTTADAKLLGITEATSYICKGRKTSLPSKLHAPV